MKGKVSTLMGRSTYFRRDFWDALNDVKKWSRFDDFYGVLKRIFWGTFKCFKRIF